MQATIHPFVLCYVDPEKEIVCQKVFACISNHMTPGTGAVYTFLQVLVIEHIKPKHPFIKKIIVLVRSQLLNTRITKILQICHIMKLISA